MINYPASDAGGRRRKAPAAAPKTSGEKIPKSDAESVLVELRRLRDPRIREQMSSRFGIVTGNAFGVRMNQMRELAKKIGRNHALALALWKTGNYEARTVAAFITEPERVTPAQMDRWCRDFDNWAICDTICFHLFDRTPHALAKIMRWSGARGEFQKRAAFSLLASLALHDKQADNKAFINCLPLIETASADGRNFVKKAVSWALRAIGGRNRELHLASANLARRLAASGHPASRWVGKDVLRGLEKGTSRGGW